MMLLHAKFQLSPSISLGAIGAPLVHISLFGFYCRSWPSPVGPHGPAANVPPTMAKVQGDPAANVPHGPAANVPPAMAFHLIDTY